MAKARTIKLKLPKELECNYEGDAIKVTDFNDWMKCKAFINDIPIKGMLQKMVITIEIDQATLISMDFSEDVHVTEVVDLDVIEDFGGTALIPTIFTGGVTDSVDAEDEPEEEQNE